MAVRGRGRLVGDPFGSTQVDKVFIADAGSGVAPPVEIEEAIFVMTGRVVVRPMDERAVARIRNQFALHADAIADGHGNPRGELHVVDDLDVVAVVAADLERFVHGLRVLPEEEVRLRRYGAGKSDFARRVRTEPGRKRGRCGEVRGHRSHSVRTVTRLLMNR